MKRKSVLWLILILMAACFAFAKMNTYLHRKSWEKETSPLPRESISLLCKNLSLELKDSLCDGSGDVYAKDFTTALYKRFPQGNAMETPKEDATTTYSEVNELLGNFLVDCGNAENSSEFSFYVCLYDLRGDRQWINAFYFYYPEDTLFSIRSSSSSDD